MILLIKDTSMSIAKFFKATTESLQIQLGVLSDLFQSNHTMPSDFKTVLFTVETFSTNYSPLRERQRTRFLITYIRRARIMYPTRIPDKIQYPSFR